MKKTKLIVSLVLILVGIGVFAVMAYLIQKNYMLYGIRDGYTFEAYFKEEALNIHDFGGMTIASIALVFIGLFFGLLWELVGWIRKTELWATYSGWIPIILIAVVVIVLVVSCVNIAGGGSSSGDNTGEARCSNCGGDGWDSANGCSCVWCGGDGKTSWNP